MSDYCKYDLQADTLASCNYHDVAYWSSVPESRPARRVFVALTPEERLWTDFSSVAPIAFWEKGRSCRKHGWRLHDTGEAQGVPHAIMDIS